MELKFALGGNIDFVVHHFFGLIVLADDLGDYFHAAALLGGIGHHMAAFYRSKDADLRAVPGSHHHVTRDLAEAQQGITAYREEAIEMLGVKGKGSKNQYAGKQAREAAGAGPTWHPFPHYLDLISSGSSMALKRSPF
jgi:hypothetical protein